MTSPRLALTSRDEHTIRHRYSDFFFSNNKRLAHHFLSYPGDDRLEVFYSLPVLGRTAVGIVNGVVSAVLVQATQVFLASRRGHDRSF